MKSLASLTASTIALSGAAFAEDIRNFDLAAFDKIEIASGVTAQITVGGEQSVRVETNKGDYDDLVIKVKGGVLEIRQDWKKGWRISSKKPRYKLIATVADLNSVDASSGSNLSATGISAGDFSVEVSSGASVKLGGTCDQIDAKGSSGAGASAKNLVCNNADARASSGASLVLHADTGVEAKASSGGTITVYGGAQKVSTRKSSGGSVRIRD